MTGSIGQFNTKEHAMRIVRNVAAALALGLTLAVTGCFGGGAKVDQSITTVSKGKELEDLKRALDEGAINQKEYDRLRERVMKRKN
jgi:hypothetical protein